MDNIQKEFLAGFRYKAFKKYVMICWVFLLGGMALFFLIGLMAGFFPRNGIVFRLLSQAGWLSALSSLLMGFAGVYALHAGEGDELPSFRKPFFRVIRRTHYFFGIVFIPALMMLILLSFESGVTALAYVPYAGPVVSALSSLPFFLANVFFIWVFIAIILVMPPIAVSSEGFRDLLNKTAMLLKKRWLGILIYAVISFAVLFLSLTVLYYMVRYALGITHSVQWKINAAYPQSISSMNLGSYAVDIIKRITPRADPIAAFKTYGTRVFDFLDILRVMIGVFYTLLFSFIVSLPMAVYFRFSSIFFDRIRLRETIR